MKTLIFTVGGKGGIGKSLALLTLADAMSQEGVSFSVVDCDGENAGKPGALHRFLPKATRYDIRSVADLDALIEAAAGATAETTLVDLPANAGGDFLAWAADAFHPTTLNELALRVVALGVVTREPASLASLVAWAQVLESSVSYAVALNRRQLERVEIPSDIAFADYFRCGFREAANPVEIELPGLYEPAAIQMQAYSVLPSLGAGDKRIDVLNRVRIRAFSEKTHAAWTSVFPALVGQNAETQRDLK